MQMESYPTKDSGRAARPHRTCIGTRRSDDAACHQLELPLARARRQTTHSRRLWSGGRPVVDDPASDGASSELASPGVGEKAERRWEDDDDSAAGPCEDDRDDAVQPHGALPFGVALPPDPAKRYPARNRADKQHYWCSA